MRWEKLFHSKFRHFFYSNKSSSSSNKKRVHWIGYSKRKISENRSIVTEYSLEVHILNKTKIEKKKTLFYHCLAFICVRRIYRNEKNSRIYTYSHIQISSFMISYFLFIRFFLLPYVPIDFVFYLIFINRLLCVLKRNAFFSN